MPLLIKGKFCDREFYYIFAFQWQFFIFSESIVLVFSNYTTFSQFLKEKHFIFANLMLIDIINQA